MYGQVTGFIQMLNRYYINVAMGTIRSG